MTIAEKFRQHLRFEILVPFYTQMESKRRKEAGNLTKQSAHPIYDATEEKIVATVMKAIKENTVHDHSKCPIPETCIGYQSALEDVEYALGVKK